MYRGVGDSPGGYSAAIGSAQEPMISSAIGKIKTAIGSVTIARANANVAQLSVGDFVYEGDLIETGIDGRVGILFVDGTTFHLYASARVVLDEFIYGAEKSSNSALLHVTKGKFGFIGGKMATAGRLIIDTPLGKIQNAAPTAGIGSLALIFLSCLIDDVEAQALSLSANILRVDDGIITLDFGLYEILTNDPIPRLIVVYPGELVVLKKGSGGTVSVDQVAMNPTQFLQQQTDYRDAHATYAQAQQDPFIQQLQQQGPGQNNRADAQPQSTTSPGSTSSSGSGTPPSVTSTTGTTTVAQNTTPPPPPPPTPTTTTVDTTPPPPPPPPPPSTPSVQTAASIAITPPIAGDNVVNASEAAAGFTISGTETGANGQTVTVKIVNSSNAVVDTYTTTALSDGTWSVGVTAAQAQALANGSYTVTTNVSDTAGNLAAGLAGDHGASSATGADGGAGGGDRGGGLADQPEPGRDGERPAGRQQQPGDTGGERDPGRGRAERWPRPQLHGDDRQHLGRRRGLDAVEPDDHAGERQQLHADHRGDRKDAGGNLSTTTTSTEAVTVNPLAPTVTPVAETGRGGLGDCAPSRGHGQQRDRGERRQPGQQPGLAGGERDPGRGRAERRQRPQLHGDGRQHLGRCSHLEPVEPDHHAGQRRQLHADHRGDRKDAGGNLSTTTTSTEAVTVNPLAPTVTPVAETGVEGSAIALHLGVTVNSETGANGDSPANSLASLVVSAIPVGAVLSDGNGHSFTATAGNTSVDVHTWNLSSLTITPANDSNFTLTIAATEHDAEGNLSTTTTGTEAVTITITGTNDAPVISLVSTDSACRDAGRDQCGADGFRHADGHRCRSLRHGDARRW